MSAQLGPLRQIALPCSNLSRSIAFYREAVGLEFIAAIEAAGLAFFRLGGTRLLLERADSAGHGGAVLYFEVEDIDAACAALTERGIAFDTLPHLIHRDDSGTFGPPGGEEWMAFFKDPDGNVLALAARTAAARS